MGIIKTPELSEEVKNFLDSGFLRDKPIKKNYPEFEECFVLLHPFIEIKLGHENKIAFKTGFWPNKFEITNHCEILSWTKFLQISGIRDYKSLDACLSFYHRARNLTERSEYKKLLNALKNDNPKIISPQVDEIPPILENDILQYLIKIGYSKLYVYTDFDDKNKLSNIEDLINIPIGLPSHVRLETPDNKILIAQDFDQRFSYLFSTKVILNEMIKQLDLEGFFCTDETPEAWSFSNIADNEKIDWNEDFQRIREEY